MAQVTMDIAELDKLRTEIKDKEEKLKEVEKELYEVRADKRVLKITPGLDRLDLVAYIPRNMTGIDSIVIAERGNARGFSSFYNDSFSKEFSYYIGRQPKKEFVNFEDVKEEIKNELEQKYNEEIGQLRAYKTEGQRDLATLRTQKNKEISELTDKHFTEILDLNTIFNKEKVELQKKITELETGVKEKTEIEYLKQDIKNLNELLYKEQSKTWWKKLLNK